MLYAILLTQGIAVGLLYSLVGLGFSLIFRTAGLLNFSLGELVMIGSLIGFSVLSASSMPFVLAMILVMICVGFVSVLTERLVFSSIRTRGGAAVNAVVAGIGLLMIFNQLGLLIWGAQPLSYPPRFAATAVLVGPFVFPSQTLWIAGLSLGLMVVLQLFLRRTTMGVALRAVADDRLMSEMLGVNSRRITMYTFVVGGALAGVSGVLLGPLYYASYTMGIIGIKGFAAAILGGLGNLPGAILGGIVIGAIESFSTVYISSAYREVIAYGLLIAMLLLRPQGFLGSISRVDT